MSPIKGLKIIHEKIAKILQFIDKKPGWSHAFHKGRSILTNAQPHKKSKFVFNCDISDFYRSIHFGRISGIFKNYLKFDKPAADFLSHLCCFNGALPPGSPCAPALANLAARSLDREMLKAAKEHRLVYTRYADDLTFSTKLKNFPASIGHFLNPSSLSGPAQASLSLVNSIHLSGFAINPLKTRIQHRKQNQSVTGLTVNEFPNVKRSKIKHIRKLIYLLDKFGASKSASYIISPMATDKDFFDILYGHLSYVKSIRGSDDIIVKRFCRDISRITTKCPKWVKTGALEFEVKDIFLSHASEDKAQIALPLFEACKKIGLSVFYDADAIVWGDSIVERINKGLGEAKIFVPIITKNFLEKKWPEKELNSAFSRFMSDKNRILPIVHEVDGLNHYPLMADILYKHWDAREEFPNEIAELLKSRVSMI